MRTRTLLSIALTAVLTAACGSSYEAPPAATSGSQGAPQGTAQGAPAAHPMQQANPGVPPGTGRVLETMNSGGYTYVNVDLGGKTAWAAGPEVVCKAGDVVTLPQGMPMSGYHSKTLDRTFEVVYFVGGIEVQSGDGGGKIAEDLGGSERSKVDTGAVAAGSVARVDGGQTVEEIISGGADLSGKDIAVRGRVVKFNANIMGTNWLHIQDGSGAAGTSDLTVTTAATVDVGDVVVVRGKVTTDKDFGAGYKYAVIVENADIAVE